MQRPGKRIAVRAMSFPGRCIWPGLWVQPTCRVCVPGMFHIGIGIGIGIG
ncbi:hypothetical protein RVF83_17210 [Gordonia rubripertincta]|nr:hypothetical protein [Gordonia rubripertincta]ASR03123.1 hypothetical protein GCWB2_11630 [Gordonia rubripertincta]MDG6782110.1 hypothetical protein [Gordonia rubripertincta]NKY64671.1 hypothetical protein [Gordonia rubripertincta]